MIRITTFPHGLPRNPDPDADFLKDMYAGFKSSFNGSMRTRYEILTDLKATPEQQKEMRQLSAWLVGMGFIEGVLVSLLVAVIYFLLTYMV